MVAPLATYRITDDRATVRTAPHGRQIRRLVRDETFQGRPDQRGWIARIDDDGVTVTGYIKAALCERLDMPAVAQIATAPDALGQAVDSLAAWLAFGRTRERATAIRALFGDFAAAVVGAAASQAASVMTHLIARQEQDHAALGELQQRVVALEALHERAVGE